MVVEKKIDTNISTSGGVEIFEELLSTIAAGFSPEKSLITQEIILLVFSP